MCHLLMDRAACIADVFTRAWESACEVDRVYLVLRYPNASTADSVLMYYIVHSIGERS
jgi:hypothetical protein